MLDPTLCLLYLFSLGVVHELRYKPFFITLNKHAFNLSSLGTSYTRISSHKIHQIHVSLAVIKYIKYTSLWSYGGIHRGRKYYKLRVILWRQPQWDVWATCYLETAFLDMFMNIFYLCDTLRWFNTDFILQCQTFRWQKADFSYLDDRMQTSHI